MRFRIPSIKSFSGNIILTVFIALTLFSYGVFLLTKQIKTNLTDQYTKCLVVKTRWIQSTIFKKLESAILVSDIPGENNNSHLSNATGLCHFEISDNQIQITKDDTHFHSSPEKLEVINYFLNNAPIINNRVYYSLKKFEHSYYFVAFKNSKDSAGKITGTMAISQASVDSVLLHLIDQNLSIIQSAILIPDTILFSSGSSTCLENEISCASLSSKTQHFFNCEDNKDKRKLFWVRASLANEIQLILVFHSVQTYSKPILYLISSFTLLLLGIVFFPVIERRKYQHQLGEINEMIEHISQKEFNNLLSEEYPGKLGTLTRSLNKMSSQLKEMYHDLEIRVIRRTSEISMRNAELRIKQREILQQNQELKSAYEALKESQEKYEQLIEHLEDEYFFYSISQSGTLLFVSPSVKKILGYEVKEYRNIHDQIYSDNPMNKNALKCEKNLMSGIAQPKFFKEVYDNKQGEKILEISEVPIFNDNGQLVSIEGLAHDITERQKAEELIKEQEEKYRMLFTHASDFIFLYKIDRKNNKVGNFIEANRYTLNKLGYTLEELRDMNPLNLLSNEMDSAEENQVNELAINDSKFERIWESKEEQPINVEISAHALTIKDKEVAIAVARDITARKKAEEEIRFVNEELVNQKENLESLVDNLTETQEQLVQSEKMAALGQLIAGIAHEINTPLGAIKASIGNMLDSLNTALNELPDLFQKQSVEDLNLFNIVFKNTQQSSKAELSSREKRQKRRELSSVLNGQQIPDAELVADALVYLEIYDASNDLLLNLKKTDALKVVRSARNFISIKKNTNTINLAVEKATKVVFALKKYAHRDAMGEKVSTDITDSIETVLTLYQNQLKQGIEIVRNYGKLPLIQCYQDEISQVWTNLIQNAIQAMNMEGILTITTIQKGDTIEVSFKDNGPGVEPDIRDKIFEPFYTTKKQGEGSGLGLDIVKKIVDKHNGNVELESKMGEGANFKIILPLGTEQK